MLINLVALLVAGISTILVTPLVKKIATHFDVIDKPDRKRKHHRRLVPLWGGLAIAAAMLLTFICCQLWLSDFQTIMRYRDGILFGQLKWISSAFLLITIVGLLDDKRALPPKIKLLMQLIAVSLVIGTGLYIKGIAWPVDGCIIHFWPWVGMVLTAGWMLFIINAYNFIDGVDGLASSQAIVIGLGLMIVGLVISEQSEMVLFKYQSQLGSVLTAACAGAAWGFLRYNRFPAQLFLGDAGSTLLGFSLSLGTIFIMGETTRAAVPWAVLLILGWPIMDTTQVIIRRKVHGAPISKADNRHLHHELQKKGFTKTATVAFITLVSLILSGLGIGLLWL